MRRYIRWLLAAVFAGLSGCSPEADTRDPLDAPTLTEEGVGGGQIGVVFAFENETDVALQCSVLGKSCACTDLRFEPEMVAPGGVTCLTLVGPRSGLVVSGWVDLLWSDGKSTRIDYSVIDDHPGLRVFPRAISRSALSGSRRLSIDYLAVWPSGIPGGSIKPRIGIGDISLMVEAGEPEIISPLVMAGRWTVWAERSIQGVFAPVEITFGGLPPVSVDVF